MRLRYFLRIRFTAVILLTTLCLSVSAQQDSPAPMRGKVEAMRIAFITERLNLSPSEAKLFWPVYNSYKHDLTQLRRSYYPHADGTDPPLDATGQIEFEQKKLDLKKSYIPEFEQAIGRDKVNKLVNAEEDFKKLLMQTVRNRRQQRPGGYR